MVGKPSTPSRYHVQGKPADVTGTYWCAQCGHSVDTMRSPHEQCSSGPGKFGKADE